MNKEINILIYSMLNNLFISILKVIGGFIYHLDSLFADGLQTFCNFVTDIICLVSCKISKHKPTKSHPFGFGKVEYLANLFIGIILIPLGIYLIKNGLTSKPHTPNLNVIYLLMIVFALKLIAILIMQKAGTKNKSNLIVTSIKESRLDLYSTIAVAIITVLMQFQATMPILGYTDLIGTILIGILILKTACTIIIDNSLSLIGEVEVNTELTSQVSTILETKFHLKEYEITLIKYGSYYKLQLKIVPPSKMALKSIMNLEKRIHRSIIASRKLRIKYITIYITRKL